MADKISLKNSTVALTENRLSRNEMWCVVDNMSHMCKVFLYSKFN